MQVDIQKNIKLSSFSTLKIGGRAKFFVVVKNEDEFLAALTWARKKSKKIFILGGGSNTLFSDSDFDGLVIKNEIRGTELVSENENSVIIKSYSGETWSKLVNFAISRKYYGAENLFYIPGTVGASPVQNIGAYGVELKDIFYNLCAIDLENGEKKHFNLKDCQFSYRHSFFKGEGKNRYFILWVAIKLSKKEKFNLDYGDIRNKLLAKGIEKPSLEDVSSVIQEMRNDKIPNPAVLANAGSFFKNPIVDSTFFEKIKSEFPDIKSFPDLKGVKIPAAWLIEKCGLKGYRYKNVGVYEKQALILVNYGNAKQEDLLFLVEFIRKSVFDSFAIILEPEVNILK
ncbi:UDP-N-acetylenolpyruvoylglucosamine reductase [Candidatus Falkowbacteria bacterium HGW-Falkowbacteria-1]|uniref:UDP-N-acetylenolpyruvoylglucosamine reductase n=1 Tax=Candidatus Falkowbacteria bacterium HGW-Falkowbacteria-1 TaxID=2013768 RepID=A0A2N2E9R2_9BACT|nr:MAG: UDP-N-acetylenolpyruvoylglucosamine reductase [Candidatus Falkowbacteria bacterium HGW-Falkowbacteria-1]